MSHCVYVHPSVHTYIPPEAQVRPRPEAGPSLSQPEPEPWGAQARPKPSPGDVQIRPKGPKPGSGRPREALGRPQEAQGRP